MAATNTNASTVASNLYLATIKATRPAMMNKVVEAKNDMLRIRLPRICVSTMRTSRSSIRFIQRRR